MKTAPPLLACLLLASPACVAQIPGVAQEQDVVYTKAGDQELRLDIARPSEGDGPFPAVLVIHGGGWRPGQRMCGP